MDLSKVKVGKTVIIKKINLKGTLKRKFMDMGILEGEMVTLEKIAPMGDPLEVTIKNYKLSLRKNEASLIEVEEVQ
ncbi:MAG: hypothetical protein DKM50_08830 [Candidatus Margulisiibacteriota bacterium]|nr:MAG: iron transporter FeoA [Candidatus Margulisbacteria bacterium GWD2_39_127]OGI04048.1 MAG: iron transporter FeoA [Candidatus Margulisbacteria bacterium GWF2_38_17]OGI05991.1 MAG: iron transporter FeoA [Candidatus Margulisbacteria bacterium GWE2_39_32]PZM79553.1 MAG: hypothetical protein DKM50_08830 [Candidatus Margulisiibacteriota bacterium]HAR63395.1 hypothetical protein [Candidatus Margulisiibacteriota bacterium]